jgi:catechol 2,3-dioxygenase-like lactoylglutathione lyase family enzyme
MEKAMLPSPVIDLKTFVPAKDPALSRAFYTDLGFTINWGNDQIAELQMGAFRFLLQRFYVADHAGNFMMSLAGHRRPTVRCARWPALKSHLRELNQTCNCPRT